MTARSTLVKKKQTYFVRFSLLQRIEHLVMLLSFSALGLTGLPQKFALNPLSVALVRLAGGVDNLRLIHHAAAIVMMFGATLHILAAGYKIFVERRYMTMLPGLQDAKDAWASLRYNLGFQRHRPQMGRYTFEEKMEYWAFVWGAVVMGATGFLMWNPITATKFLPGEFIPAAKAAHGGEAVLAVLAIIIWHFYGVHFKHFNKAMWTGRMTEEEMLREHPRELADIKAGVASRPVDRKSARVRQKVYFPAAVILTLVILAGIYGFISAEQTALTTIPPQPEKVEAFVPQTPTPMPTPLPTATPLPLPTIAPEDATWNNLIGQIFAAKCAACHGTMGGLSLAAYADALAGGTNGPAVVPGNAAGSLLVQRFLDGSHSYAVLTTDELALIQAWIDNGAPEQ